MKPICYSVNALLVLILVAGTVSLAQAQERGSDFPRVSPNASVSQTIGVTDVTITYARPSVRDRTIFGDLVPYGEVWRTGANEATTITFSTDVEVEGQPLEAGTYGLFTVPGPDEWAIVFNEAANQWGAYEYDQTQDVLRVTTEPEQAPMQEMLTFTFENVTSDSAEVVLHWADVKVPFTVTANTDAVVMEQARTVVANADDWRIPLRYAAYALENDLQYEAALDWANRSIEVEKNFTNLRVKANLLAKMGQYQQAVEIGQEAIAAGEAQPQAPDGIDELKEQVEQWRSQL